MELILGYIFALIGNLLVALNSTKNRFIGYSFCMISCICFLYHGLVVQYSDIIWIFLLYIGINTIGLFKNKDIFCKPTIQ